MLIIFTLFVSFKLLNLSHIMLIGTLDYNGGWALLHIFLLNN
jgi:hypothetical protein